MRAINEMMTKTAVAGRYLGALQLLFAYLRKSEVAKADLIPRSIARQSTPCRS